MRIQYEKSLGRRETEKKQLEFQVRQLLYQFLDVALDSFPSSSLCVLNLPVKERTILHATLTKQLIDFEFVWKCLKKMELRRTIRLGPSMRIVTDILLYSEISYKCITIRGPTIKQQFPARNI